LTRINSLSGYINSTSSNIVFTTGDQTISGSKTFAASSYLFSGVDVIFTNNTGIVSGQWQFANRPTVNGTGVLLSGERNKKFIYSGATRGPASRNVSNVYNNIAYGANCTFTPRYVGTIKAEASVGLTVPSTTSDTIQAATFWYGTGTPPVFSGNLNDLDGKVRIGGIKGTPQTSATSPTVQFSPIGASWVAEVTGLTTGTTYWFDIAMSGRFLLVQDVQIYLEEIY
jgi:hypothetical protein